MTPEGREPDMPHADTHTPLHGPTGGVPSDKALSDRAEGVPTRLRPTFCCLFTSMYIKNESRWATLRRKARGSSASHDEGGGLGGRTESRQGWSAPSGAGMVQLMNTFSRNVR
eukprot:scaffold20708_cov129-Isochrysis_galbana.AAC.3